MSDQGAGGLSVILCHYCQQPVSFKYEGIEHTVGTPLCRRPAVEAMTEHLPECNYQKNPERNVCICERLRACEERVLAAAREAVSAVLAHEDHCKGKIRNYCNCSRFEALNAIDVLND